MNKINRKKDIWQKDKDHFIHPWVEFQEFEKNGPFIRKSAEGVYVKDIDDNVYLDGIAGMCCVNIGYGRKKIAHIAKDQILQLSYCLQHHHNISAPVADLSAKLCNLAPDNINHVTYSMSGSVANDTAVRIIHHYFNLLGKPEKKHIISREHAYHGSTYLAMSITGVWEDQQEFDVEQDWIHHLSSPHTYHRDENLDDTAYCNALIQQFEDKILEIGPEKVAIYIAEPIVGVGEVITPPAGYNKRMWQVCQKYDIKYISDEVITAFGRFGHMFVSEDMFGVKPDIISLAKGLTSGYMPLGATMISDEIYNVISSKSNGLPFSHGFTYSGHPVACAVALENICIIEEEGICENVSRIGPYFEYRMKELKDLNIVGDVRGSHFMYCIECVADKNTKHAFSPEIKPGTRVAEYAQKAGLLVRPLGDKVGVSPPLTLNMDQIDFLVDTLRSSILKVQQDLETTDILKIG